MAGFLKGGSALIVLFMMAACGGGHVPDDVADTMAYRDQQAFEARRAALRGESGLPMAAAVAPVSAAPAPAPDVVAVAASAIAAVEAAPLPPAPAITPARAAQPATTAADRLPSDELDRVVAEGRESGATTTAEQVVATPPVRPASADPNIVDYALSTTHPLGVRRYPRSPFAQSHGEAACGDFRSDDLAQEWFLQNGGPGRDRRGIDPDGDGYACGWNPSATRAAAASTN